MLDYCKEKAQKKRKKNLLMLPHKESLSKLEYFKDVFLTLKHYK